jgi:hypothetical protein
VCCGVCYWSAGIGRVPIEHLCWPKRDSTRRLLHITQMLLLKRDCYVDKLRYNHVHQTFSTKTRSEYLCRRVDKIVF